MSWLEVLIVLAVILILAAIIIPLALEYRAPESIEIVAEKTIIPERGFGLTSINRKICTVSQNDYMRAKVESEFKCRWHE